METQDGFSFDAINLELQRVLNFTLFKNSPALSGFLEYIVLETLGGRSSQIKEYTIAVNVIKRPSTFNGADDAIVRIHAGRLRRALSLYYATEGQSNEIYIDIPKGCYIPEFKYREKAQVNNYSYKSLPVFHGNPTVAIFPFKCLSAGKDENVFALLLGEEVSAELSKFQDISVTGYYSMEMISKINQNILEAGIAAGADYIITGTIQFTDERVRIRMNLLITATGEVMMTKSLEKDVTFGMFEIQDEIVQSFIAAIGGYYGCIFQEIATASPIKASVNIKVREAIYAYYQYQRSFSVEHFKTAVMQLEQAVDQHPDSATAMAMLGELYLDGTVLAIETIEDPLEGGYRCSSQALKIDPLCQHAWHTLTWGLGIEKYTIASTEKIKPGKHNIKFDFAYKGGRGAGGTGTIFVDNAKKAQGEIPKTHSNMFGIDESADVGVDLNTPVNPDYNGKSSFNGKIAQVTVEIKK